MELNLPADNIPIFPILTKLAFDFVLIENETILQFDKWCPNVTELVFSESQFLNDDIFKAFYSADKIYHEVKTLHFHFRPNELTREWLDGINKKFPKLENLRLQIETYEQFRRFEPGCDEPDRPLYFKNLKKLTLFVYSTSDTFGFDVEYMFDFLAISNQKLKKLTIHGVDFHEEWFKWIEKCKKLNKLNIDCSWFPEDSLNYLDTMPMLHEVHLEVERFHWDHRDMFSFIRKHPKLKLIDVDSVRKNKQLKYDNKFMEMFYDLIEERGKFTIRAIYNEGGREMNISENGFSEIISYEPSSSEEGY